jgi:hypothetical protein
MPVELGAFLFSFALAGAATGWRPIDDVVMGGMSASRAVQTDRGTLLFTGRVSLENNGGFASIRSAPQRFDIAGQGGIALRVKGDGKRYKVNLRTDTEFDGVQFQAALEPPAGEWTTIVLPFTAFRATFRGRPAAGALDPARIATVGLMIADAQAGPFAIEIEWIRAWRE